MYDALYIIGVRKWSLKGQSNEIFDLQFFSSFEPAWATKISLSYLNFSVNKTDSPRGVKQKNLPRTFLQKLKNVALY